MQRIFTILQAAPVDGRKILIDRDTVLVNGTSPSGTGLLTSSPTRTFAQLLTPAADELVDDVLFYMAGFPVQLQLSRGDVIYFCCNSAGAYLLVFDDPASAETS